MNDTNAVQPDIESLRHQHTEANSNLRHYSGLRFIIFTVYFAVSGGVCSIAFDLIGSKYTGATNVAVVARWTGLLVTFVFFYLEYICEFYLRHFHHAVRHLEDLLGHHVAKRPHPKFRPVYVTWSLYAVAAGFWIYVLVRGS